jgi:hypothetical protein
MSREKFRQRNIFLSFLDKGQIIFHMLRSEIRARLNMIMLSQGIRILVSNIGGGAFPFSSNPLLSVNEEFC